MSKLFERWFWKDNLKERILPREADIHESLFIVSLTIQERMPNPAYARAWLKVEGMRVNEYGEREMACGTVIFRISDGQRMTAMIGENGIGGEIQ